MKLSKSLMAWLARAVAAHAVWQLGAVSDSSRRRDIDDVAQYIVTGNWPERRG